MENFITYMLLRGQRTLAGFRRAEREEKTYRREFHEWNLSSGKYGKFILSL
jgi:hypothetical protein